jgi:hypothetical protein
VDILLNCPHCDGTASFRPPRMGGRSGRLLGRCSSCDSVFSLFGGRLSDVELGHRLVDVLPTVRAALARDRAT